MPPVHLGGCGGSAAARVVVPSYGVAGHIKAISVSTAIRRALLAVGIEGHAHQLRHTFGTQVLKSSGGNLRVAQERLGHANPASIALYCIVEQDDLRAAVLGLPGTAASPLRLVDERWRSSGLQPA
jgi:integrase/recombinase XerD